MRALLKNGADCIFVHMPCMGKLKKPGVDRNKYPRADEQEQHDRPPHHVIDNTVDPFNQFQQIHRVYNPRQNKYRTCIIKTKSIQKPSAVSYVPIKPFITSLSLFCFPSRGLY
jgi:hypothetical protein